MNSLPAEDFAGTALFAASRHEFAVHIRRRPHRRVEDTTPQYALRALGRRGDLAEFVERLSQLAVIVANPGVRPAGCSTRLFYLSLTIEPTR